MFRVVTVLRENFSGVVAGGWFPTTCFLFLYYSNAKKKQTENTPLSVLLLSWPRPLFFFSPPSIHPSSAWVFSPQNACCCGASATRSFLVTCGCRRGGLVRLWAGPLLLRPFPSLHTPASFFTEGTIKIKNKKTPGALGV